MSRAFVSESWATEQVEMTHAQAIERAESAAEEGRRLCDRLEARRALREARAAAGKRCER